VNAKSASPMSSVDSSSEFLDDPFEAWYAPTIDRDMLRGLMRRTDRHALVNLGLWLALCAATGAGVVLVRHTLWLWPAMLLYGGVLCFAYAASHECAHGTAFRSRWLNEAVFWFTSLVFIEEPLYRRYSHAGHHTHTWFNRLDPQKPYGNPLRLGRYLSSTAGLVFYYDAAAQLFRHSLGRFTAQEVEFLPAEEVRKVVFNSRVMSACYVGLLVAGIAFEWPFILYFIPRFLGGCIINLYINTQHMCMAEDLPDHRRTTRSIRGGRLERLLYWNMNYHIEHHLFPAVPFHALPRLNAEIGSQLPAPIAGVIAANIEIVKAISRQRADPLFNLSRVN
jgi:fatty acid desaturase